MTAEKDPQGAIMAEAKQMLDDGELPQKVSSKLLWSGLIAIHARVGKINGQVSKNKTRISWLYWILGGVGTVGTILLTRTIGLFF